MGDYYINKDGSVTHNSGKRTVRNIDWIDFRQANGTQYSIRDIIALL